MRKTTFRQWVLTAKVTDDPVGDFIQDARHDIKIGNHTFWTRPIRGPARLRLYFGLNNACAGCLGTAAGRWCARALAASRARRSLATAPGAESPL
jgi:hypothetical protein